MAQGRLTAEELEQLRVLVAQSLGPLTSAAIRQHPTTILKLGKRLRWFHAVLSTSPRPIEVWIKLDSHEAARKAACIKMGVIWAEFERKPKSSAEYRCTECSAPTVEQLVRTKYYTDEQAKALLCRTNDGLSAADNNGAFFAGTWKIIDSNGNVELRFILKQQGQAEKVRDGVQTIPGQWRFAQDSAWIEWKDEWKDVLELDNDGSVTKIAFGRKKDWTDEPDNCQTACKEK